MSPQTIDLKKNCYNVPLTVKPEEIVVDMRNTWPMSPLNQLLTTIIFKIWKYPHLTKLNSNLNLQFTHSSISSPFSLSLMIYLKHFLFL